MEKAFLAKKIRSPVHLAGGDEAQVLEAFDGIKPTDWLFSNWRSSYHAIIKGMSERSVYSAILAGRSMFLSSRTHRFYCSSIVGGILPIACGVALSVKRSGGLERVWVAVGDMTARTGLFYEFLSYCDGHQLPVIVVIADNGYSTDTPTKAAWGSGVSYQASNVPIIHYQYERTYPHVGCHERVTF